MRRPAFIPARSKASTIRLTAVIPVLCCFVALILSFLCLFAGHKASFMEDYDLMTLNTSLLGQTFLDDSRPTSTSNPFTNLINTIPNEISNAINDGIGKLTDQLGIEDYYSAHILNYCYGQYTPVEVPNATVERDDISKNATGCSESKSMYKFDPTRIIQEALDKTTGLKVTLDDLKWPSDIQTGIDALNALMGAMFVFYVMAICSIFIAFLAAVSAVLASGRISACLNIFIAIVAFFSIGLASALVTAVLVKATDIINEHGKGIGIEANKGGKFLALTWVATALMFIVVMGWVVEVGLGRRQSNRATLAKHG